MCRYRLLRFEIPADALTNDRAAGALKHVATSIKTQLPIFSTTLEFKNSQDGT